MVATRRTAPTAADPEMADPELALKKKPIRKATAKTAAKTETGTKAKNTRGKKAEPEIVEEEPEAVEEVPKTRATRGRPKKNVEPPVEAEAQPEVSEPEKPAKATRVTNTSTARSKKAAVAVEEAPQLQAPKDAKPTRQTRAAASKAAPLSPKKITQVVKPSARNNAKGGQKSASNVQPAKSSVRSRATARGRQVSDENAEVPELAKPEAEDDFVVLVSSTPVKKPVTRRQAAKEQEADESEMSISTRDTTPTASPAQSQDRDAGSEAEEPSVNLSTPEKQDRTADDEESDDELCGPKTPMRRGSPGAEARYHSSAQRTIRKYNEEQRLQTPARRYAILGSQRGTPQTQKPYCKPMPPSSEVRPMTVSRGASRAFVFKDLREGAPALPQKQSQQQHKAIAEEEDLSFIPDDNIIAMDDEENTQITTPMGPAPLQLASPPTSVTDVEDLEDEQDDLSSVQSSDEPEVSAHGVDEDLAQEDPDATIITEEQDDETEDEVPMQPDANSFETEDTVIITRADKEDAGDVPMSIIDDLRLDSVIYQEAHASSDPETMVWENVHSEQTITVDFDGHLGEARSLPEPEPTEVLEIAMALNNNREEINDVDSVSERETYDMQDAAVEDPIQSEVDRLPVPTPAVDLNEYFDMSALAEPTQVFDFASQTAEAVDTEMEDEALLSLSDDVAESNEIDHTVSANRSPVGDDAEVGAADEFNHIEEHQDADNFDQLSQDEESAVEEDELDHTTAEEAEQSPLPHYARSTFAFDARRKSLPATSMVTPVKIGSRPNTSDGASMPRIANLFGQAWWARSRANSINASPSGKPFKMRPSTAHAADAASEFSTPAEKVTPAKERYPVFAPRQNQVDHSQTIAAMRFKDVSEKRTTRRQTFHRATSEKAKETPLPAKTTPAAVETPAQKPKERYPALPSQPNYVDHSRTTAPPSRFKNAATKPADRRKTFHNAMAGKTQAAATPAKASSPADAETPAATPKERSPVLGSRADHIDHAKTAAPPSRFQHPSSKPANRRETFHRAMSGKTAEKEIADEVPVKTPVQEKIATPKPLQTPTERFPRLRPRADYQDHAMTIAAPRFQTPPQGPLKRPATMQKPSSIRKAALRNSASTPMKTPLKAPAMTPGQEPMTPHPAAPLHGVVALVEVYTLEGASASAPFIALLHRLGAKTTRAWTDRVTHVVFKDGSPTTLQRVRLHNKDVAASGKGREICCVNSRWVSDCDVAGAREDEIDEAYAVDVEEIPRGGKRRRKSMEPSALMNLGGNVVRDRKASLGRSSLGRSSMLSSESPAKKAKLEDSEVAATPGAEAREDKENSDEEPATPAWIAQPDKLVQQTAPMKRVRKLELQGAKSRRLTFWDGRD